MRRSLADIFDLPKDVVLNLPRLTMVGQVQLLVENHRGVVSFAGDHLVLGHKSGRIRIHGSDLTIASVDEDEVFVTGRIESVEFEGDGVGAQ